MIPRSVPAGIAVVLLLCLAGGVAGQPQGSDHIRSLIARLADRSWESAVAQLAAVGEPAVGPLAAALETTRDLPAGRACLALGRIGTPAAADVLVAALSSRDARVREYAAQALGGIRSERVVTALMSVADTDTGAVQRAAVASLGAIGDSRAVPSVARLLESRAWYIRAQAVDALGRIRSDAAVRTLASALDDADGRVREGARSALASFGGMAVGPAATVLGSPKVALRWQAAWVLGHAASPDAVEPLLRAIGDADRMVRVEAAVGLVRTSGDAAIDGLTQAAASANPGAREEAAWAVAAIRARHRTLPTAWPGPVVAATAAARRCAPERSSATIASGAITYLRRSYRLYPETLDRLPDLPSPLTAADGTEVVVAALSGGRYAVVPVTLDPRRRQCTADEVDFPTLARTGLHADAELEQTRTITGRSIGEITELGRPGRLSDEGFLAEDEEIVPVLGADNRTVAALGLTHPDLARPLFHIWNMMQTDLDLGRWSMAEHQWRNVTAVLSHRRWVSVEAGDTKGGQRSPFDDKLEGSFQIEIARTPTEAERAFLARRYGHLTRGQVDALTRAISRIRTGEMQPHLVTWYGFYEGRTPWRVSPVAIAFIFGLVSLERIEAAFPGQLYERLVRRS